MWKFEIGLLLSSNLADKGRTSLVSFRILTRKEVRQLDFGGKLIDKDD